MTGEEGFHELCTFAKISPLRLRRLVVTQVTNIGRLIFLSNLSMMVSIIWLLKIVGQKWLIPVISYCHR